MPKKKVTIKPKQTKSPKKEPSKRKTMRSSEEVKGIFYDESALHSDESEFESDDENESQPRIDEDLESSSSSEEEKKDTDEDESDEDEAETEYEDSDEEIRPSSKKFRLNSSTVLKAKKLKTKKPKTHKEPKWKWRRIHYNKKYADLQQIKRDNNLNPEPLNTFSNPLKGKKENPIYYLQLLLDNKFFEKVIHETNLAKKISQELKKNGIENNADSHRMTRSMTKNKYVNDEQRDKKKISHRKMEGPDCCRIQNISRTFLLDGINETTRDGGSLVDGHNLSKP